METCRNKNPFEVRKMSSDDFWSSNQLEKAITNRKVDVNKAKINWLGNFLFKEKTDSQGTFTIDTHEILLEKSDPFVLKMYKIPGGNFQVLSILKRGKSTSLKNIQLEKLWPEGKPLSKEKVKDLNDLLAFLPSVAQQTFSFLENIVQHDFSDDVDGFGEYVDFEIEKDD